MTWQGEKFKGKVGVTMPESEASCRMPPRPKEGSPNVIFIVIDDIGFGHLGCYGAPIDTPNIDRLAKTGLRYNNFHTTALCSPTRSCLLTGRNHHTNGLGMISELSQGYPGYDGLILPSRGFLSEILHDKGYANYAIGKWHLVPTEEGTMSGPFDRWPLGRGFDKRKSDSPPRGREAYACGTRGCSSIWPPRSLRRASSACIRRRLTASWH